MAVTKNLNILSLDCNVNVLLTSDKNMEHLFMGLGFKFLGCLLFY